MLILPGFLDSASVAELLSANADSLAPRRGTTCTDVPLSAIHVTMAADLSARVLNHLADHFYHLPTLQRDYAAFTEVHPGGSHHLHADAQVADGGPNHTPERVATAMLYLGNEGQDFDGGVLRLPGIGVDVFPRAGLLVGFLTDWLHRHEVTPVTRGVRPAVAFWFKASK